MIRVAPGEKQMTRGRLEAFSDGVIAIIIAIIITIMVLAMKAPQQRVWKTWAPLVPTFLTYVLSFVYVGIYWNNHHHMLHAVTVVTGAMLWADLHLLFWLSLFPFATAWMGESRFAGVPTALLWRGAADGRDCVSRAPAGDLFKIDSFLPASLTSLTPDNFHRHF